MNARIVPLRLRPVKPDSNIAVTLVINFKMRFFGGRKARGDGSKRG
jgi:hypothetical protein